ncbi:Acyltransferase [Roseimaritima multifibrata]|uniref:Acyltransferase n=1 Tax=Roseimaritima multifibrata TaxID=1930274 RepID=A0A517MLU8_9BACT|nr:1-acyl-sn-glycerol-3-phosphate acyltransferase [Roseimaritima multifibrata]QDS95864.1 Acyltransferase [Roseimaritima multifibrata]
MSVIVEKPYQFIPPYRGNAWPTWIQRLHIVDFYLRRKDGIVGYECRNLESVAESLNKRDGILLAPNHCRYSDPLVLGWPARELKQHVYAIASWHLFNKNAFESFAIRRMGAFSLFREGNDRQSLETAIEILNNAERPLIIFPEGTTNRTNDHLQPLLEGVAFLARTAAKRREKQSGGSVVIHPTWIKYVIQGDIHAWANQALSQLEKPLGWQRTNGRTVLQRIERLATGLLSLQEIEYTGSVHPGDLDERRKRLIATLLQRTEAEAGVTPSAEPIPVLHRVRNLRTKLLPRLLATESETEKEKIRHSLREVDMAQQLESYVTGYLVPEECTDTRILETIQRMQEDFLGDVDTSLPLKAIIEFDDAIPVPPSRAPRGQVDPILIELEQRLRVLKDRLQHEARPFVDR